MSKVRYLKKKKMFGLAQKILGSDCSVKLLDCEYHFYRGSEWLLFSDDGYCYKLYSCRLVITWLLKKVFMMMMMLVILFIVVC